MLGFSLTLPIGGQLPCCGAAALDDEDLMGLRDLFPPCFLFQGLGEPFPFPLGLGGTGCFLFGFLAFLCLSSSSSLFLSILADKSMGGRGVKSYTPESTPSELCVSGQSSLEVLPFAE